MNCKHAFSKSSSLQPPAKTIPVEKNVGVNRPASTKTKENYIPLKDPIRNDCSS